MRDALVVIDLLQRFDHKVSILAGACATTDPELERLAFEYAERVVGARVER